MWHATWRGGQWEGPLAVVSGPYMDDIDNSFDPNDASAIVVQGNVILLLGVPIQVANSQVSGLLASNSIRLNYQ